MGKKLLEIVRDKIRFKHYSYRTEQVYLGWAKRPKYSGFKSSVKDTNSKGQRDS